MAKTFWLTFLIASLFALGVHPAIGATISGTIKDPSGAPFRGAFVQARSLKTKITTTVLSDSQGLYRTPDLPPGEYSVSATAIGFTNDTHPSAMLTAGEPATLNFALRKGIVRWSDLNEYQGMKLLPEGKGKALLEKQCFACHAFQTRMAAIRRDEKGWARAVSYMRETEHYRLFDFTDQDAAEVVSYLNRYFGVDSELPRSPADLPEYKETVRTFSDDALKIVYVDYEMPGPNRHPFSAAPDKEGYLWIPYMGRANQIARLDPKTGEVEEFRVPNQGTAGIHSAVPAPDGTVWLAEQGSNKIGKWDPKTRAITEYQDAYLPGKEGTDKGGTKHTLRIGQNGMVWSTGFPFTLFDPKTREFHHFQEVPSSYGVAIDRDGNGWFAEWNMEGKIGKADVKTGKVTKYGLPTPHAMPRRIEIDSSGIVWVAEWRGGKIARFDPKTETFQEFPLPGPATMPYALGIDRQNRIWYSSEYLDTVGCLDPKTGKVVEYPFPYSENTMREFFMDAEGRMWFGTPSNNKVGYFIAPEQP